MAEMTKQAPGQTGTIPIATTTAAGEVGGKVTLSEQVVAKIAGLAARDIEGIHSLGRPRLISIGEAAAQRGVAAEVGNVEAALDIDVVLEYGAEIDTVARALRQRIAAEVGRMAGRKVIEVNINILDIHLPEPERETTAAQPRVR